MQAKIDKLTQVFESALASAQHQRSMRASGCPHQSSSFPLCRWCRKSSYGLQYGCQQAVHCQQPLPQQLLLLLWGAKRPQEIRHRHHAPSLGAQQSAPQQGGPCGAWGPVEQVVVGPVHLYSNLSLGYWWVLVGVGGCGGFWWVLLGFGVCGVYVADTDGDEDVTVSI